MIQRIQTIFLALVALSLFLTLFFPIWIKQSLDATQFVSLDAFNMAHIQNDNLLQNTSTFYMAILAFMGASMAVGSIFSYKNRLTQMKLNFLNTLVISSIMGLSVYFLFQGTRYFEVENQGSFGIGFFTAPAALIFNMMANRFIRRDEKLVRSVDRLR